MSAAIEIHGVSKRFRVNHLRHTSLKERVVHWRRTRAEQRAADEFWALRDIDLTIQPGETVGLLGHNGSGKSTLLKCIAGIYQPTEGAVVTRGRISALLELGAGFHPELTGRENVYMNGSILGMSKRDIDARFDDIVGFAELEPFIDNQVKHYSSGMYVRLGFAVAVTVEPEILLVDEVLAVGDERFQRKCLDRVRQFQREGRTIVVVTHGPDLIRAIGDWAAVLDHGRLVAVAPPGEAIREFRDYLLLGRPIWAHVDEAAAEAIEAAAAAAAEAEPASLLQITDVRIDHANLHRRPYVLPGEALDIRVTYEATAPLDDVVFALDIIDIEGKHLVGVNTEGIGTDLGVLQGVGEVVFTIAAVPLLDGTYPLSFGVHNKSGGVIYAQRYQRDSFEVMNPGQKHGLVDIPVTARVEAPAHPVSA
jgi:ABC-2 type transport system ATP-binding protein